MILLIVALFLLLRDAFQSIHLRHVSFASLLEIWGQVNARSMSATQAALERSAQPALVSAFHFLLAVPACAVATLLGGLCWMLSAALPRR
jgi:type II secretory pathway component PulM